MKQVKVAVREEYIKPISGYLAISASAINNS
jgi:hypothetical protein